MDSEKKQNAPRPSSDLDDSPLRRRIQANAGSTSPAQDRPEPGPVKRTPQPDKSDRSIRPAELLPLIAIFIVAWLWVLDVIPSPISFFTSPDAEGADSPGTFWAVVSGLLLALGAGYIIWLVRRFAGLGRYHSPYQADADGYGSRKRRKTLSGRLLRYLAFAMIIQLIALILGWGVKD